jgi:small-conductance mechanosensitive channel
MSSSSTARSVGKVLQEKYIIRKKEKDMDIQVTNEDVQAVMQSNPMVAVQVQNQALMRELQATKVAFDASMDEVKRLTEEVEQLKNGKSPKEK